MPCTRRSSVSALNDSVPCTFSWTTERNNHFSASSAKSSLRDWTRRDNTEDLCCSRTCSDNNRRSCGCLANQKMRNNGYRIGSKIAKRDTGTSLVQGIMAWMSSSGCESNVDHRRRRPLGRRPRPGAGGGGGGASLLLALCVTGIVASRGGVGVAAARLPIIEEVYRANGNEPGIVGNPGNVEVDPSSLASPAEQQQALLEYLDDPPFQSQMYSQQQLMQLALRLRENPELLAQIMSLAPAARRYSLIEEVLARMPAAAAAAASPIEATPAPPQPKRGNYMALCHFKICNMGRKRRQEMP